MPSPRRKPALSLTCAMALPVFLRPISIALDSMWRCGLWTAVCAFALRAPPKDILVPSQHSGTGTDLSTRGICWSVPVLAITSLADVKA